MEDIYGALNVKGTATFKDGENQIEVEVEVTGQYVGENIYMWPTSGSFLIHNPGQ